MVIGVSASIDGISRIMEIKDSGINEMLLNLKAYPSSVIESIGGVGSLIGSKFVISRIFERNRDLNKMLSDISLNPKL